MTERPLETGDCCTMSSKCVASRQNGTFVCLMYQNHLEWYAGRTLAQTLLLPTL